MSMTFGEAVADAMVAKGLSRPELAEIVGIKEYQLGCYLRDELAKPTARVVDALCVELNIPEATAKECLKNTRERNRAKKTGLDPNEFQEVSLYTIFKKWHWDSHRLLAELFKLDFEAMPDLKGNDKVQGTIGQWAAVVDQCPEFVKIITAKRRRFAAYLLAVALDDDTFEKALDCSLLESEITVETSRRIVKLGSYKLYIVAVLTRPEYRSLGQPCIFGLLRAFANQLVILANNGVFIEQICGTTLTDRGRKLCVELGMDPVGEHKHKLLKGKWVYKLDMSPLPDWLKFNEELVSLYAN